MSKITDEEIQAGLDESQTVAEIARDYHVDPSTIYRRINKMSATASVEDEKYAVTDADEPLPITSQFDEDFPKVDSTQILDFVCLDIETTNLTADFSVLLCACIKPFGKAPIVFRIDDYNKNWKTKRRDDSGIVKAIAEELSKHAIVVTHYGSKFDIPYLKAKMTRYGLPPLNPMYQLDTWRIAKNNFQVGSRRLASLCTYFELGGKSGVEGPLWMKAGLDGDVKALDEIVKHNIQDVALLERLMALSWRYVKSIPKV